MPSHVHLDCCGAALGHSSQQLTIQGSSLEQAKQIFDLLVPLAPIVLALSAATPFLKGYLTDTDTRWGCISQGKFIRRSKFMTFRLLLTGIDPIESVRELRKLIIELLN